MNTPVSARWAQQFPELGTDPVPTDALLSEDYFRREKDKLFKRTWLKLARTEELPEPGSWKLKPVPIWDSTIILVRGEDGRIRGFHNTCSHRGNRVIWARDGHGRDRRFSCHFHGWTYNLAGELVHVPREDEFFPTFCKADNGLAPVAVDEWEGFVFAHLDPQPRVGLAEYLGAAATRLAGFPYGDMTAVYAYRTVLECNWKIAQDAFSEAYHVTTIHAGSFPEGFSAKLYEVQLLGPHRTSAVYMDDKGPTPTPVAALAHRLGTTSIAKRGTRVSLPPQVNPTRSPNFAFELSVLFPNFLVHIMDGLYFTHQFHPLAVDRTLWEGIQYFPPPRTAGERFSQEYGQVLQRNAWLEDTATMEATHAALKSGAKKFMHLQDQEILLRHHYQVVDEYVRA